MLKQNTTPDLEAFIADAISHLAAELRLVDLADYIAYMRMERHAYIADIVRDAAELYFMPGFVEFGMDGETATDWGSPAAVTLELVLRGFRTRTHIALTLCEEHAEVKLGYIDLAHGFEGRADHADLLIDDIVDNTLGYRARPLRLSGFIRLPSSDLPQADF
jgi:hypothetical protein